ncbi:MAG: TPM domain-containing protein [Saprospiraceae bacterium]
MKCKFLISIAFSLFWIANLSGQSFTPETVPNIKIQNNSHISDPSNILDEETYNQIDSKLTFLEDSVGSEVALVMLPSIGEAVPKDFAYKLFNLWGIGKKGLDNGLLILFVLDQKRVEFETGNGLESVLPDAICKRIITNELIPSFKNEAYGEGLLKGVNAISSIIQNPENAVEFEEKENKGEGGFFLEMYGYLTAFVNGIILLLLGRSFKKDETPYNKYHTLKKYNITPLAFIFPIPFLGILWFVRKEMKKWRNTPPQEPHGVKLSKEQENRSHSHLNTGQSKEAELGVAEYDVWVGDGVEPTILRYIKSPKSYTKCPSCNFQTEKLTSSTTLRAATYSNTGEELLRYACLHCGNQREKINIIPKKVRSSSSGGSGGGRSGGSWGGGRSSGGGAGGSW